MKTMPISHIQPATGTYEYWSPLIYMYKLKKVRATTNLIKDKMTRRVGIPLHIFEQIT